MDLGVDYSFMRPSRSCLSSKGYRFVGRYFGPGSRGKHATRAECDSIHANGMTVVSFVEGAEKDALRGYTMGANHAASGEVAAGIAGMPIDRPLYLAIDFDFLAHHHLPVARYLEGAASVLTVARVGVYGGRSLIEWAYSNGLASWFHQTSSWSYGVWSRHNHIEQYRHGVWTCGAEVDLNRAKQADYGQWPAPDQTWGGNPSGPPSNDGSPSWDYNGLISGIVHTGDSHLSNMEHFASQMNGLRS